MTKRESINARTRAGRTNGLKTLKTQKSDLKRQIRSLAFRRSVPSAGESILQMTKTLWFDLLIYFT